MLFHELKEEAINESVIDKAKHILKILKMEGDTIKINLAKDRLEEIKDKHPDKIKLIKQIEDYFSYIEDDLKEYDILRKKVFSSKPGTVNKELTKIKSISNKVKGTLEKINNISKDKGKDLGFKITLSGLGIVLLSALFGAITPGAIGLAMMGIGGGKMKEKGDNVKELNDKDTSAKSTYELNKYLKREK